MFCFDTLNSMQWGAKMNRKLRDILFQQGKFYWHRTARGRRWYRRLTTGSRHPRRTTGTRIQENKPSVRNPWQWIFVLLTVILFTRFKQWNNYFLVKSMKQFLTWAVMSPPRLTLASHCCPDVYCQLWKSLSQHQICCLKIMSRAICREDKIFSY